MPDPGCGVGAPQSGFAVRGAQALVVSRRQRIQNAARIAITAFVLVLLIIVSLGWTWTTRHQPPALRTASHVVLGLAALAGIFAVTRIWRRDGRPQSDRA
jgi:membrane protein YdbS with pleckstrin-like domain